MLPGATCSSNISSTTTRQTVTFTTSTTSVLNSSVTLYVCDLHEPYVAPNPDVKRLNTVISRVFMAVSIALVPIYSGAASIINVKSLIKTSRGIRPFDAGATIGFRPKRCQLLRGSSGLPERTARDGWSVDKATRHRSVTHGFRR
jgi:hypothetical protein